VPPKHEVKKFPVYCAVALAGIGELPDTIMSRSIIIKMRRRAPNERCEQLRMRIEEPIGKALRDRIEAWADDVGDDVVKKWPELPTGIVDRNAEIWEPLIAVADVAGGDWPVKTREACVALCKSAEDRRVSLGIRLLGDLRILFGEATSVTTKSLLERLVSEDSGLDDDAPWANLRGNPISSRKLASLLKRYGVKSKKVKIDGISLQGYRREDLWDSWQRYLPPEESGNAEPLEPAEPNRKDEPFSPESEVPEVLDTEQKVPDGGNGSFGLETAETQGPVPRVPEVPARRESVDVDTCPRCDGEGCGWCCEPVESRVALN